MTIFPQNHLGEMVHMTSVQLSKIEDREAKIGEILKLFSTVVLMSRFEFGDRRSLRATANNRKYIEAPKFGRVMFRENFEILHTWIRFIRYSSSEQENKTTAR